MTEAMTEKGYVGTSVADILQRAGVSRETFYQQFSSKLDCFMAAFDLAADILLDRLSASLPPTGSPLERFTGALTAYLDTLAAFPSHARLFLVEVYAAGPEAIARRAEVQTLLVDALVALLEVERAEERTACQLLVAGVGSLVIPPLVAGDPEGVQALRDPVIALAAMVLGDA
jgi:AcrR family transcriptional regulator